MDKKKFRKNTACGWVTPDSEIPEPISYVIYIIIHARGVFYVVVARFFSSPISTKKQINRKNRIFQPISNSIHYTYLFANNTLCSSERFLTTLSFVFVERLILRRPLTVTLRSPSTYSGCASLGFDCPSLIRSDAFACASLSPSLDDRHKFLSDISTAVSYWFRFAFHVAVIDPVANERTGADRNVLLFVGRLVRRGRSMIRPCTWSTDEFTASTRMAIDREANEGLGVCIFQLATKKTVCFVYTRIR